MAILGVHGPDHAVNDAGELAAGIGARLGLNTRMKMREIMNIVEGEVVDLKAEKTKRAADGYLDAVQGLYGVESNFFTNGKFAPFAQSYIASNFDPAFKPKIELEVKFRDPRRSPNARVLFDRLRQEGFRYVPAIKWAKGARPKQNANQDGWGGFATKAITLDEARAIFTDRAYSPYGAYQPSRSGFRTDYERNWNDDGVGFNIVVSGQDARRGDKYGNEARHEAHIVDDDKDMAEVVKMFAMIRRARMGVVHT